MPRFLRQDNRFKLLIKTVFYASHHIIEKSEVVAGHVFFGGDHVSENYVGIFDQIEKRKLNYEC